MSLNFSKHYVKEMFRSLNQKDISFFLQHRDFLIQILWGLCLQNCPEKKQPTYYC